MEDNTTNNDYIRELQQLFGSERFEGGYFEWNRESLKALYIDEKENAIDSLETSLQFLERKDNLKWKWIAFALHHSLYSFCISALENGNYENVLDRSKEDELIVGFSIPPSQKKSRVTPFFIKNFKTSAFRIEWDDFSEPLTPKSKGRRISKDKLIGFWSALARVQDQYFWMGQLSCTKAITITDEELEKIVWLTEVVRNDLTHFIPKGYAIDIRSIINSSFVILDKIESLVFHSSSILFVDYKTSTERIKTALDSLRNKLTEEINSIDKS